MKKEKISTPVADIQRGSDGIIRLRYTIPGTEVKLEDIKAVRAAIWEMSDGQKRPVLADIRNLKGSDREVTKYSSGEEMAQSLKAAAILSDSVISRVLGNLFIGIGKPPFPTRLFNSETEAVEWLKGFVDG